MHLVLVFQMLQQHQGVVVSLQARAAARQHQQRPVAAQRGMLRRGPCARGGVGLDREPLLDPIAAGRRLANYLAVMTLECQTIARACGKSHVHNLEPEDLVALTVEAAAMARVPLAGTDWIPGRNGS